MINRHYLESYKDLDDSGKRLEVYLSVGMIHIRVDGGRQVGESIFLLDSEEVDDLCETLQSAKKMVQDRSVK